MAYTSYFLALKARIAQLEFLLPNQPPNDETEEQQQQDNIRAFLLLCHAEVETFVEDLAKILGESLVAELRNFRLGTRFSRSHAEAAERRYVDAISSNHGVKESNLLTMFGLFGFSEKTFVDIDPGFLSEFNSYGSTRGDSAHKGAARATRRLYGRSQKIKIERLLTMLAGLESEVRRACLNGLLAPNSRDI
ncbi:hypothetical protein PQR67_35670 [Paraburkholderia fungorum]|uniref:HEPN domain-containing protein n=1 Tax=Paraburkholderia fungorum TaxID=134537 RepID=UPI0038B895E8